TFPKTDVDQQIREVDRVAIGGLLFVAHIAAGETKGCTTWTTQVRWERKPYDVVFAGCHPHKPDTLKAIKSDVFLGARQLLRPREEVRAPPRETESVHRSRGIPEVPR